MKIFTKSVLVAIAMMAGVTTASAQDEWMDPEQWVEVVPEMWHEWADPGTRDPDTGVAGRCTGKAEIVGEMTPVWELNTDKGMGACILGAENVSHNLFADLSGYDKLLLFGTSTAQTRVMCNREINEGAWKNLMVGFSAEDTHYNADLDCIVIDLSEIKTMTLTANGAGDSEGMKTGDERIDDYVHFHCIKNGWFGDNTVNVSAIYVWKSNDPTGIKNVKANVEDGAYYNLAGQKVANPEKGVFIHNGKKIVKK